MHEAKSPCTRQKEGPDTKHYLSLSEMVAIIQWHTLTKIGQGCCLLSLIGCTLACVAYFGLPRERKIGLPASMFHLSVADALLGIALVNNLIAEIPLLNSLCLDG